MQEKNPYWYKDAILYELHVRALYDSDEDGIGDFRGLAEKLDYLQDLGVTGIWLLPFYPSPLKDDGYDIADYTGIHPNYGTWADFRDFVQAAHHRGLRVVTEAVFPCHFLSGVTSDTGTLDEQLDVILPRIGGSLQDAGASWANVVKLSCFLHRSQTVQDLRTGILRILGAEGRKLLAGEAPVEVAYGFVDGYSTPGKLIEIETTAVR